MYSIQLQCPSVLQTCLSFLTCLYSWLPPSGRLPSSLLFHPLSKEERLFNFQTLLLPYATSPASQSKSGSPVIYFHQSMFLYSRRCDSVCDQLFIIWLINVLIPKYSLVPMKERIVSGLASCFSLAFKPKGLLHRRNSTLLNNWMNDFLILGYVIKIFHVSSQKPQILSNAWSYHIPRKIWRLELNFWLKQSKSSFLIDVVSL